MICFKETNQITSWVEVYPNYGQFVWVKSTSKSNGLRLKTGLIDFTEFTKFIEEDND